MTDVITVEGLVTTFGHVRALDGLDLRVQPGEVSLWPNLSGGEVIDLLGRLRWPFSARPSCSARSATPAVWTARSRGCPGCSPNP